MDDPLLVGVLDGAADGDEELEALAAAVRAAKGALPRMPWYISTPTA